MKGTGLGLGPGQEIAKGAGVLELEGRAAAGVPFGGLLLGQPGVLVVELVAQAIELRVHAVLDQAPFAPARGCGVQQHLPQLHRKGR